MERCKDREGEREVRENEGEIAEWWNVKVRRWIKDEGMNRKGWIKDGRHNGWMDVEMR